MFEKWPSSEDPIDENQVLEGLRVDMESPATSGPLIGWLEQGERGVSSGVGAIQFGVKTDMLYHQAGYSRAALENLENERYASQCEGAAELEDDITELMYSIESEMGQ
ncbi:hypothetical protein A3C91_03050 [Candidatus Azambacteria bacterium RIFCSPHIGHO2_02_FULL_52_12]|uniref:Uncharacterized protein n=1 Tax=Candidatus Azambacteria bacterium RIFCSPLOWO2_01_FULL_46_25 TaxID=1797298 RepID=A0A1F5BTB1_9BACT|nr:MAG: hypothetical protein A3C91_03050 [Candidatus Azambacteria bacterium RIFCSPHIGHO2_02_FULL_52_12]OGD33811.1 MAG: hypothetical protein A2988_01915 [Candidatus Azambacteria bacterium RIFCSPLOWO2_01_FULL_46_25]OGD36815.1 MAG: hypothetical protein A2850_02465 [Candidatus Azambacteria bacterium RIFCSPHIGHO2_01_FULL_51_74]